eukprot:2338559-Pyramimonas_sp.AAC.1
MLWALPLWTPQCGPSYCCGVHNRIGVHSRRVRTNGVHNMRVSNRGVRGMVHDRRGPTTSCGPP